MTDALEWFTKEIRETRNKNIIETMPPLSGKKITRVLLLSDIHANWEALKAVISHAQGLYDTTWFLGDVVGYGPQPVDCVQILQYRLSFGGRWVAGNHDLGLLSISQNDEANDYFSAEEADWSSKRHLQLLREQSDLYNWFRDSLASDHQKPKTRKYGGFKQIFVHANLDNYVGNYLYPDYRTSIQTRLRKLLATNSRTPQKDLVCVFVGHTHMVTLIHLPDKIGAAELLPITYGKEISLLKGAYLINPGSVGQPRDGDPRAAYAILNVERNNRSITFYRVCYDVVEVQKLLRDDNYPEELVKRLGNGRIRRTAENFERVYENRKDRTGVDVR